MSSGQIAYLLFPVNAEIIGYDDHQAPALEKPARAYQGFAEAAAFFLGTGFQSRADHRHGMGPPFSRRDDFAYLAVKEDH